MSIKKFIITTLLAGAFFALRAQNPYTEEQKITHLISYVRSLDATFIRNGSGYNPSQAADHLQVKRSYAGSKITTAEDFIGKLASRSSLTGKPYLVRFKNGKEFPCEMVLKFELKNLENGKS